MNIYVGNLSFDATEDQIREAFEAFGEITSVNVITDRDSGRPRGFCFVEMANDDEGKAAIAGLNGEPMNDRELKVSEARPRENKGGGGRGGGDRGGYNRRRF